MPIVKFTSNLTRFHPNLTNFKANSRSIVHLIGEIDARYPGIKSYIIDDQNALRKHVNIFINNKMITDRITLKDPIREEDEIYIMQALSGG